MGTEHASQHAGKQALRVRMKAIRNNLSSEERTELSTRLSQVVITQAIEPLAHELGRPLTICVYAAFRSEADPLAILAWSQAVGHRTVAPRVLEGEVGMELRYVRDAADWTIGRYGVPSPDGERTQRLAEGDRPDIVLVPGLAFDRTGGRLGYGGGYYDRLSAEWGTTALPLWIGFAFGVQLSDEDLPREPHDLPLQGLATEHGLHWFNEGRAWGCRTQMD